MLCCTIAALASENDIAGFELPYEKSDVKAAEPRPVNPLLAAASTRSARAKASEAPAEQKHEL